MNGTPLGDFMYKQMLVRFNDILLEMRDDLNNTGLVISSPFEVTDEDINNLMNEEDDK